MQAPSPGPPPTCSPNSDLQPASLISCQQPRSANSLGNLCAAACSESTPLTTRGLASRGSQSISGVLSTLVWASSYRPANTTLYRDQSLSSRCPYLPIDRASGGFAVTLTLQTTPCVHALRHITPWALLSSAAHALAAHTSPPLLRQQTPRKRHVPPPLLRITHGLRADCSAASAR